MRNEGGWDVAALRWCCCCLVGYACVYDGKARGSGVLRVRKKLQSKQRMGTHLWICSRYTAQRVGPTPLKHIHVICTNQVCGVQEDVKGKAEADSVQRKTRRKRKNSMYLSVSSFQAYHSARQIPLHQHKFTHAKYVRANEPGAITTKQCSGTESHQRAASLSPGLCPQIP